MSAAKPPQRLGVLIANLDHAVAGWRRTEFASSIIVVAEPHVQALVVTVRGLRLVIGGNKFFSYEECPAQAIRDHCRRHLASLEDDAAVF